MPMTAEETTHTPKILRLPVPDPVDPEPDLDDVYESPRRPLPFKRRSQTFKLRCNGQRLFLGCGEYENGRLGEIFIDVGKDGTVIRSQMNMFAISLSLAIQHGTPLREYVAAFSEYAQFDRPAPVTGYPGIETAISLFDMVVRVLDAEYGDGKRRAAASPETCDDEVCEPCTEMLHDTSCDDTACAKHADEDGHRAEPEV